MNNKNKDRSVDDMAEASRKFLEGIADLMGRLDIPPGLAFGMFGYFARSVIEVAVEENGADHSEAAMAAFKAFANGLGLNGGFVEIRGEVAQQVQAQYERQNDDKPLQ